MPLIPISSRKHQMLKQDSKSPLFHAVRSSIDKTLIIAKEIPQELAKTSSEVVAKIQANEWKTQEDDRLSCCSFFDSQAELKELEEKYDDDESITLADLHF